MVTGALGCLRESHFPHKEVILLGDQLDDPLFLPISQIKSVKVTGEVLLFKSYPMVSSVRTWGTLSILPETHILSLF